MDISVSDFVQHEFFEKYPPEGDGAPHLLSTNQIQSMLHSLNGGSLEMEIPIVDWLRVNGYKTAIGYAPEEGIYWETFPSFPLD